MKWVKGSLVTVAIVVAIILSSMDQMLMLKSAFFILILLHGAIIDVKTKTIPDYIPLTIIISGFIGIELSSSLLGLILVPLPYFIMAIIKENSMGGGDIKLMGACGFYLGLSAGTLGSIIGLFLAVIIHSSYTTITKKNMDKSIPLAPYLGTGCLIAHMIFNY
jgi:leader peptidase (prepilin peptidase)/N-methyltransferase